MVRARNQRSFAKHKVAVKSSQLASAGLGLFATAELGPGSLVPLKGPFLKQAECLAFLSSQSPENASRLKSRIVEVHLKSGDEVVAFYKVMTGVGGRAGSIFAKFSVPELEALPSQVLRTATPTWAALTPSCFGIPMKAREPPNANPSASGSKLKTERFQAGFVMSFFGGLPTNSLSGVGPS